MPRARHVKRHFSPLFVWRDTNIAVLPPALATFPALEAARTLDLPEAVERYLLIVRAFRQAGRGMQLRAGLAYRPVEFKSLLLSSGLPFSIWLIAGPDSEVSTPLTEAA